MPHSQRWSSPYDFLPRSRRVRTLLERQLDEAERLESEAIMRKRALKKQLEKQKKRIEVVIPVQKSQLPRVHSKFNSSAPKSLLHSAKTIPNPAGFQLASSRQNPSGSKSRSRNRTDTKESDPEWVPSSDASSLIVNESQGKGESHNCEAPILSVSSDAFTDGSMLSPLTTERSKSIPSSMDLDDGILYDMRSTPGSRNREETAKRRTPETSPEQLSDVTSTSNVRYVPVVEKETEYIAFVPQSKRQQDLELRRERTNIKSHQKPKEAQKRGELQKRETTMRRIVDTQSEQSNGCIQKTTPDHSLESFSAMRQQMESIQKQLDLAQKQMQAMIPVLEQFSRMSRKKRAYFFDSDREETWGVRSSASFRLEGADNALPSIEVDDDLENGLSAISGDTKTRNRSTYSVKKRESTSSSPAYPQAKRIKSESTGISDTPRAEAKPNDEADRVIYTESSILTTPSHFSLPEAQFTQSYDVSSPRLYKSSTRSPAPTRSSGFTHKLYEGVVLGELRLITPITIIKKSPSRSPESLSGKPTNYKLEEVKRTLRISPTTLHVSQFSPSRHSMCTPTSIASGVTSAPGTPHCDSYDSRFPSAKLGEEEVSPLPFQTDQLQQSSPKAPSSSPSSREPSRSPSSSPVEPQSIFQIQQTSSKLSSPTPSSRRSSQFPFSSPAEPQAVFRVQQIQQSSPQAPSPSPSSQSSRSPSPSPAESQPYNNCLATNLDRVLGRVSSTTPDKHLEQEVLEADEFTGDDFDMFSEGQGDGASGDEGPVLEDASSELENSLIGLLDL